MIDLSPNVHCHGHRGSRELHGESYQIEDVSEGDIRAEWNDGGFGRGTWALTITADISAPPGIGGFVDSNEDYDITWTAVTYEVVLEPIVDL